MEQALHLLHYVVEIAAVAVIGGITIAYLITGYYETPIILAAFGAITTIAAAETYRKHKETLKERGTK